MHTTDVCFLDMKAVVKNTLTVIAQNYDNVYQSRFDKFINTSDSVISNHNKTALGYTTKFLFQCVTQTWKSVAYSIKSDIINASAVIKKLIRSESQVLAPIVFFVCFFSFWHTISYVRPFDGLFSLAQSKVMSGKFRETQVKIS